MDDSDFIFRMQRRAVLDRGRKLSPEEAAREFALHPHHVRVAHLESLKTPEAMSLRETADRHAFERAIRGVHQRLQKVGR